MMAYLWVAIGGAIGSLARFWIGGLASAKFGMAFPWGTIIVNISGSFLIGLIGSVASPEGRMDPKTRVFATQFLMTGICGGYTTFSSFSWQTLQLLEERQWLYAGSNAVFSVTLCMLAVWLGYLVGSWIRH